ncbi:hypothetical protein Tco_0548898 [Tanacetum coccineum]
MCSLFDKTKVECNNCHRRGHIVLENVGYQNGIGGYDWSFQAEEGITNFALMPISNLKGSSVDSEYDQQLEALNKSNLEIIGYQIGLESLEARIVVHEKNEAVYKEDVAFLKYDVKVKDISIKDLKNQLEEALKEKQLQQSPSGQVPVNAAKQSSPRAATSISTARPVNTDAPKPKVNDALPITYSYFKAHSRENAVQSSHAGFGDQQEMVIPTKTLQDQGIFNSGCSRHMTGNKSFLTIIKKYLVEFVAFRGSPTGGIKRKFSVSRTPQQNGFGLKERKDTDRATRTVLADFIITYNLWAEAVRTPSISFMRPFGCPVTILNTLDPLVKFDGKADESWEATSQLWKQPMNCQTYSHNQKYIGNMPKYQIIGDINSATQTRRMIKISEEHAMINDWIIDILEGQPKLGLWYPRDSPFDLEAFSDSDYAGASLDRKSTTGEIRENISSGMIPYEKKLIQVIKIHTDHNVADLLTKSFDVSRFNFLIA